jgi:hypothetical protein
MELISELSLVGIGFELKYFVERVLLSFSHSK